ncbi:MAG: flavin reductase [Lachnospiraceae bacterium]|nr:flavin reductase [Lachnospiraceae bacterium]
MNNKTMYRLSYGLFVVTAYNGKDNGCITNTAIQVTSEPNRISIAVNKGNYTHDMIKESGNFTVSIISEEADFELFKHFGFRSGRDVDKFADFKDCRRGDHGTMIITRGTNGYISARVVNSVDLGTHTLFIADVVDMDVLSDARSATYEYYQNNIKPKPEAVSKTPDGQTVWRCTICGYEYVGEELPEDFICPVCKHPASDFEKVSG